MLSAHRSPSKQKIKNKTEWEKKSKIFIVFWCFCFFMCFFLSSFAHFLPSSFPLVLVQWIVDVRFFPSSASCQSPWSGFWFVLLAAEKDYNRLTVTRNNDDKIVSIQQTTTEMWFSTKKIILGIKCEFESKNNGEKKRKESTKTMHSHAFKYKSHLK